MEKKGVIGIGLNLFDARAIILNDKEEIVDKVEKKYEVTAHKTIEVILDLFEEINAKASQHRVSIKGLGIALGGVVDKRRGLVYWPQRLDSSCVYISVPLKKYIEEKFKLPVIIENDANACVWAEYVKKFKDYRNIIYMFSGVGCGIILDGNLYRGRDGAAGELFVNVRKNMTSSLGDFSFLSPWPLDLGIVKKAKELIALGKSTALLKKVSSTGDLSIEEVLTQAKKDDRLAKNIVKEAAFSLGVKISFLINFINPDLVIVGGGLEEAGEFFLEEVNIAIKEYTFNEMGRGLKIVFPHLGRDAASLGAGLLILKENSLLI
ncbi:MAG: ROK family protein [Candidatus Omnitrophica bacterium]|nr:ROK family protein [Candidatus Omnitrophota bacterium]